MLAAKINKDKSCERRWRLLISVTSAIIEDIYKLYDENVQPFGLSSVSLSLPGHIANKTFLFIVLTFFSSVLLFISELFTISRGIFRVMNCEWGCQRIPVHFIIVIERRRERKSNVINQAFDSHANLSIVVIIKCCWHDKERKRERELKEEDACGQRKKSKQKIPYSEVLQSEWNSTHFICCLR